MNNQLKIMCAALALLAAGQVSASTTWTLASKYGSISSGVTVTAVSNTGGTNNSANAVNNGESQTIQSATWTNTYGGISNADGCKSGSYCDVRDLADNNVEHSIDNDQRYDMALLTFSELVKLTDLTLGWTTNDSDVTVMAYKGSGKPTLIGKTYSELVGLGWDSIGNYSDMGTTTKSINDKGVFSSYWLIGAYNPLANPDGGKVTVNGKSTYDYIKLASVSGCSAKELGCTPPSNDAPEPGSMALFGLGLLGLVYQRKRTAA